MSELIAIDVALLPPREIADLAVSLSAALPASHGQRLQLDAERLPHITLTQQFIGRADLDDATARIEEVLRGRLPLEMSITGGGGGSSAVWIAIARTPGLDDLHRQLMEALHDLEQPGGGMSAFFERDADDGDVEWVGTYRAKAAFDAYVPHVTLGHAERPPAIEPRTFSADTAAACHLGRFCSCRRVLKQWTLAR